LQSGLWLIDEHGKLGKRALALDDEGCVLWIDAKEVLIYS
jgi:hypothetical protein